MRVLLFKTYTARRVPFRWTQAKEKVNKRTYGTLGLDACALAVLAVLGSDAACSWEAAGCFGQDAASVG
jgi:hypothetical protein